MLRKAYQARGSYQAHLAPVLTEAQPDDELSIFGGRTRLIVPNRSTGHESAGPMLSHTADVEDTDSGDPLHRPASVPVHHAPHPIVNLPENLQRTFADLSGGWNGLFHEIPRPSHGLPLHPTGNQPVHPTGSGAMLDDKWSSFMHNYGILEDPMQQYPF